MLKYCLYILIVSCSHTYAGALWMENDWVDNNGAYIEIHHGPPRPIGPLHGAIFDGDVTTATEILSNPQTVNPDTLDQYGRSLLQLAAMARSNRAELLRLLVRFCHTQRINEPWGECKTTVLYDVAHYGDREQAQILLDAGADSDIQNSLGYSPLYNAVMHERIEIAQLLAERGANINRPNIIGCSPLRSAMYRDKEKKLSLCRILLMHGAHLDQHTLLEIQKEMPELLPLAFIHGGKHNHDFLQKNMPSKEFTALKNQALKATLQTDGRNTVEILRNSKRGRLPYLPPTNRESSKRAGLVSQESNQTAKIPVSLLLQDLPRTINSSKNSVPETTGITYYLKHFISEFVGSYISGK